jgi:hypothetical protein
VSAGAFPLRGVVAAKNRLHASGLTCVIHPASTFAKVAKFAIVGVIRAPRVCSGAAAFRDQIEDRAFPILVKHKTAIIAGSSLSQLRGCACTFCPQRHCRAGGGAVRISLPLALRCREVIHVEPSPTMRMGFRRNAAGAGITNARIIEGEWPKVDAPAGSVALVNHVTYLTREIVLFIKKLEQAGRRRVLITVNSLPGPTGKQRRSCPGMSN